MIFIHICQYIQYKRCGKEARPEPPAVILHSLNEPMLCKCFLLLVQQAQIQRTDELCLPVGIQGVAGQRDKLTVCLRAAVPVFFNVLFRLTLQRQVVPRGVNCVQRFIMNLAYRTMPS